MSRKYYAITDEVYVSTRWQTDKYVLKALVSCISCIKFPCPTPTLAPDLTSVPSAAVKLAAGVEGKATTGRSGRGKARRAATALLPGGAKMRD